MQKCAEKHQEKAVETAKESKNVVQGERYVVGRVLQLCAVKSFQWEYHIRRRIKKDSVLSVLFFMCKSALGCT